MSEKKQSEFEKAAAERPRAGFVIELWGFMRENKKWWLMPLIIALLIFAVLIFLSGTGVAPFIYQIW